MNYDQYYAHCKNQYKGEYTGNHPLSSNKFTNDGLSVLTYRPTSTQFEWPDNYSTIIKNIHDYCSNKISKKEDIIDDNQNMLKLDNWYDCEDIAYLGDYFGRFLEKNTYNSYCKTQAVIVYQNKKTESPNQSSWLWHYDNNINEQLKVMLYLNNVDKESGAFEVLLNEKGVGKKSDYNIPGSRIPREHIEMYNREGYKNTPIEGPAGTFTIFSPNAIHRATVPLKEPCRLAIVYNYHPYLYKNPQN